MMPPESLSVASNNVEFCKHKVFRCMWARMYVLLICTSGAHMSIKWSQWSHQRSNRQNHLINQLQPSEAIAPSIHEIPNSEERSGRIGRRIA
jgi:hypothetical protein